MRKNIFKALPLRYFSSPNNDIDFLYFKKKNNKTDFILKFEAIQINLLNFNFLSCGVNWFFFLFNGI